MTLLADRADNYTVITRLHGACWLHNDKPVWIVPYDAIHGIRVASYTVYKSVDKVPLGRDPWTIDNRNIADHVPTLEEAMVIGDEA